MNLIKQFIAALVRLAESIDQNSGTIRASTERQKGADPPEPIKTEVSFSNETERQQNCQHQRYYTVQKQIRDATRLAFTAAFICGYAAYQGCEMKRATAASEKAANAAEKAAN